MIVDDQLQSSASAPLTCLAASACPLWLWIPEISSLSSGLLPQVNVLKPLWVF